MCNRGARHIVILSRQADTRPGVAKLIEDLAVHGAKVAAVPCDITDSQQVQVAMAQVCKTSPPVRGLIQAAMVLEVLLPAQSCLLLKLLGLCLSQYEFWSLEPGNPPQGHGELESPYPLPKRGRFLHPLVVICRHSRLTRTGQLCRRYVYMWILPNMRVGLT
jgi:hypothetical protein